MHLIAIMPCRNEAWVVGASLRAALLWNDEVIVLNHASDDDTERIVLECEEEHRGRVHLIHETRSDWPEMAHRQRLLEEARKRKATHVSIVDADEILCGDLLPRTPDDDESGIRASIGQLKPGQYLHTGMFCTWRSLDEYRVGRSVWANRWDLCVAFADSLDLCWQTTNGYDHHHREPHGAHLARRLYSSGGVMHLQFAAWRRLTAKHALYKISERIKYPEKSVSAIDKMYNQALDEAGLQIKDAPAEWWAPYERFRHMIDLNAEPWQEAEANRLWNLHGADAFAGLNLFGVVGDKVAA